jgi:hypothetical protein
MSFVYSQEAHAQISELLTSERLTSYLIATKGNLPDAIRLYEKNTRLSEALYGVLQGCEVALRNSMNSALTTGIGKTDWYEHIKLNHREITMVGDAKMKLLRFGKKVIPGQIVSELTLGFWIRLMSPEYEKSLWVKHLHKAFPHYRKPDRVLIFARFEETRLLRNRIAHHEPIFRKDGAREYRKILDAIGWICPVTAAWIDSHNNLPRLVNSLR